MGWNGNYLSRPTFGYVAFFVFVHLGNHEAVMQKDVIVVTAGKFAGDVILSSMPVGRLLGSNLYWACEELLRRNQPSVCVWFQYSMRFHQEDKKVAHWRKKHLARLYNARPLSASVWCTSWIFYDIFWGGFSVFAVAFLKADLTCNFLKFSCGDTNFRNSLCLLCFNLHIVFFFCLFCVCVCVHVTSGVLQSH